MDILEVYANNVPSRELRLFSVDVEQERQFFLNWLRKQASEFSDQIAAWKHYKETELIDVDYGITDLSDLEFETEMAFHRPWVSILRAEAGIKPYCIEWRQQ